MKMLMVVQNLNLRGPLWISMKHYTYKTDSLYKHSMYGKAISGWRDLVRTVYMQYENKSHQLVL